MKAFKKLGTLVFFRISLFSAFTALVILVFLCLTAVQSGNNLNVVAQMFSAVKDSGAVLHEFSQLKTLAPMEEGDKEKMNEMLARYYLAMRYEQIPDRKEMIYRWGRGGPVYLLSYPSVYSEFAKNLDKKLESISGGISSIEIKEVKRKDNTFTITFRIHTISSENKYSVRTKQAVLTYRYTSTRRRYSPIFTNPFGLIFVSFGESNVSE